MASRVASPPAAARRRLLSRGLRWGASLLWCWGWVLSGHAQPAPSSTPAVDGSGIAFNWVRMPGAETCASSTALMQAIEAEAGNRKLFVPASEASLALDGYVAKVDAPQGFEVAFALSDASGAVLGHTLKVLPGRDCGLVTRAMVLMTDLRVHPDGTLAPPAWLSPQAQQLLAAALAGWSGNPELAPAHAEQARASATPEPAAARPEPHPPASANTPSTVTDAAPEGAAADPSEPAGRVDVSATGGLGMLPGLAFGLSVRATLVTPLGWPVELGFSAFPGSRATTADARADVDLQRASLALCPLHPVRAVLLCAGAAYGRQSMTPALAQPSTVNQTLLDVLAYAAFRLQIAGPVFASARLGLNVPLARQDYRYENVRGERRLFRMALLGGQADLGLGLSL